MIQALAGLCLLIGFLVLLEQYTNSGVWFQLRDVHHETFAVAFFALGLGILLGSIGRIMRRARIY